MYITGQITHCRNSIDLGVRFKICNVRFENTLDSNLFRVTSGTLVNCKFDKTSSSREYYEYNSSSRQEWSYVESIDHNQVPGNFKAWCKGGVVVSDSQIKPAGRTRSYNHIGQSNDYPVFRQQQVLVEAGKRLKVDIWMRKDCSMAYAPRVQLINPYAEPLIDATQLPLAEVSLSSTDTWETAMLSWTNTADTALNVIIRGLMKNAGGNFWEDWEVLPETIPGDFEPVDHIVDYADLATLSQQWLMTAPCLEADIIGSDNTVDMKDFAEFANHWFETDPLY